MIDLGEYKLSQLYANEQGTPVSGKFGFKDYPSIWVQHKTGEVMTISKEKFCKFIDECWKDF